MSLNQPSPAKRAAGVGRAPRPLPKFGAAERRRSPYLIALAATLIRYEQRSGLKKPEFAETIGISELQYRSIRRKASNPSIIQLATIAGKLRIPLFTLLGVDVPGGKKLSGLKMTAHIALVVGRKCQESGLDRIVFAKKIGVSVPQFYIMLDGRANPMLLVADALATRLGVTLWQLLGVSPIAEKR